METNIITEEGPNFGEIYIQKNIYKNNYKKTPKYIIMSEVTLEYINLSLGEFMASPGNKFTLQVHGLKIALNNTLKYGMCEVA